MSRPSRNISPNAESAKRIEALRKALGETKEQFASRMGVGRIAALYWEKARSQPSADIYVRMAKAAQRIDAASAVWFWQQVGIDLDGLRELFPEFSEQVRAVERRVREVTEETAGQVIAVPLLSGLEYISSPTSAPPGAVTAIYPLPDFLVQNPSTTSCLRAPEEWSVLHGADLLVLDSSETSFERLFGRMVLTRRRSSGKTYLGFLQSFDIEGKPIPALSILPTNDVNVTRVNAPSESGGAEQPAKTDELLSPGIFMSLTPKSDWRILARVICWLAPERELEPR